MLSMILGALNVALIGSGVLFLVVQMPRPPAG